MAFDINSVKVRSEALQVFAVEEAAHYRLLPYDFGANGGLLCIGQEGVDYSLSCREISLLFGREVFVTPLVPADDLSRLLSFNYRQGGVVTSDTIEDVPSLINEAWRMRASDIHLEPSEHQCRVRFRIDGRLLERHMVKKSSYMSLVNKIKIMSDLDISEKRLPQDGRFIYSGDVGRFDIRVSIVPTIYGEKIVLRLLTMKERHFKLDELGFLSDQYDDYIASISRPHGMILISGPTGSGKSTTLYATLELLNRGDNNILTIEDPVEYTLEGVNQVQLKEEIGLSFLKALKTFLRQDPDIIMLGEIRDEATAEMAVRSSLTGHLLLSTLHTNSALGCITRLVDMGIHPYLLSETLIACVAQRLVRILCPHCKKEVVINEHVCQQFGIAFGMKTYAACGCEHCYYTGYIGRKAIYEVVPITGDLKQALRDGEGEVSVVLKKQGIKSLGDAAVDLYVQGETSLEEILPFIN